MPLPLKLLAADEKGATAIEYALILVFVFLAVIGAWGPLGSELNGMFGDHAQAMTDAHADGALTQ